MSKPPPKRPVLPSTKPPAPSPSPDEIEEAKHRFRLKLAVELVCLVVLGLYLGPPVLQAWRVSRLHKCVPVGLDLGIRERPARLPAWLDDFAARFIGIRGNLTLPALSSEPPVRNPAWFWALFHDPFQTIAIYGPFEANPGRVLASFPQLRRLTVHDFDQRSEESWKQLFTGLRDCPQLLHLEINGARVTDAAIAPLAGHPSLRHLVISKGALTPQSARTFAALPGLAQLELGRQMPSGGVTHTPDEFRVMSAALPKVWLNVTD